MTLTEPFNKEEHLLYKFTIIFHWNSAILLKMTQEPQMEEVSLYLIITKLIWSI
jgi:hypothetical protein